jgi:hypothetical protein
MTSNEWPVASSGCQTASGELRKTTQNRWAELLPASPAGIEGLPIFPWFTSHAKFSNFTYANPKDAVDVLQFA